MMWSPGKGRVKIAFWFTVITLMFLQVGLESNLFMVDRIIKKTGVALTAPLEGESERERFLAYVEPFQHVVDNPAFMMAGTGAANRKWGGNLYGEALSASHAVFAISYYAYGVGGSICQILMMVTSFRHGLDGESIISCLVRVASVVAFCPWFSNSTAWSDGLFSVYGDYSRVRTNLCAGSASQMQSLSFFNDSEKLWVLQLLFGSD
jgi:hypothetical protein